MKKIIVMICTGLFMTGIVSCNQQKGTTDNGNKAKNEQTVDAMDTLSMVLGDVYGSSLSKTLSDVEKKTGKPVNRELFLKYLSDNLAQGKTLSEEELKDLQKRLNSAIEHVAPGSTNQEPTSFTTSQGTFNIQKALKDMYDAGVTRGTSGKQTHDMVKGSSPKSTYRSNAEKQFKGTWAALFGIPDNDEAKAVFEQAKEQYMKGFEDGWNF